MTDNTTKIMKLSSGEEIIAKLIPEEHSSTFAIAEPLKLSAVPKMTKQGLEEAISLQRWIHFSEENIYTIEKSQVILVTSASLGLVRFYEHCVRKMRAEDDTTFPSNRELREIEEDDEFDDLDDFQITSRLIH